MKHRMFCVHDVKANAYMQPWFLHQDGMAMRAFADCVNDPGHNFGRHPADYTLFFIGVFDDSTGMCITQAPMSMGNGIEFIELELGEDDILAPDSVTREGVLYNKEQGDGEA